MSYTCFVFFQNDFESLGMVLKKGVSFYFTSCTEANVHLAETIYF